MVFVSSVRQPGQRAGQLYDGERAVPAGGVDPVRAGLLADLRLQRPAAVPAARRAAGRHARRTPGEVLSLATNNLFVNTQFISTVLKIHF